MAERPNAYFRKNPGDVIQSNEWNELQVKAREEIRAHRHTGNEDGSPIPRAGIETGAIDGTLIDPAAELNVRTLTTSGNLTVKGDLAVNGKALLGDIADLLATVQGLQDDKLSRRGDTVSGTLRVQRNLFVDGAVGIGTDSPVYTLDVSGSVRLGGFSEADADEWPRVVWCGGAGWDEGLIKHSSARGFFGRSGIGLHIHESRDWGIWSSGWNALLGVEGGTGNTRIKGRLDVRSLSVVGTGRISDGTGYAVEANHMASGSLTIGSLATSYGGGQKWNASTAALMLETNGSTEIAVHDSGNRLTSLMHCEGGSTNRITIGRDMGWGTTPLVVAGGIGIGTANPEAKLHLVHVPTDAHGNTLIIGQTSASHMRLGFHDDYAWIQSHCGRPLSLNPVGNNVGIGTTEPTHKFHVVAENAVGLFESSGEMAYLRLSTKEGLANRVEIANRAGGRLSLWNNGEDVFNITRDRNVGIGTITPSQKLVVQGDHNAGRDPDSRLLYGGQLAIKSNAPQIDFIDTDPDHNNWAIMVNGSKMHFIRDPWTYTNLMLAANGNVGIGTDNPLQQLTITGGLGFANQNAGDKKLYSPKDGLLEWMTHEAAGDPGFAVSHQGQLRVYLSADGNSYFDGGNVGIGTTTPSQKLVVQGHFNAGKDPDSGMSNGGQLAIKGNAPQIDFIDTDHNDWAIHVNEGRMYFIRQPWNYSDLVLDGNGNVGIGTHAPSQKLEVVGNLNVTGRITGSLERLVSLNGDYELNLQTDRNLVIYDRGHNAVWNTRTNLSDIELKKDLSPINSALEKILSLRGVSFAWKDERLGATREIGVIAQDVEPVFPELVSAITGRKFVNYLGLIPILIEAIKEQQAQIAELRDTGRTQ